MNNFKKGTNWRRFFRQWAKINLLVFSGVLSVLIGVSCGRLPPEKFWTGDKTDSANVKQEIEKYNKDEWRGFLDTFDFVGTVDTINFQSTTVFPGDETRGLEFRIKQAYYPSRLTIKLTSQKTDTNFTFVYDTTVTIELVTKIKGVARVGCDSVQRYTKDTVIPLSQVTPWKDDMTNFPTDWTVGGMGGPWTKIEDSARSNSKPFSVKCTPNPNYDDNQNNWMQRAIDLSNYELPTVNFSIWRNLAANDSIYFEYYDNSWNVSWSGSGTDTTFRSVTADIPKTATMIRFRFYSDASGTAEGVYIDDVLLSVANSTDTLMIFSGWAGKNHLRDTIIRGDTVLTYNSLGPGKDSVVLEKQFEGQVWRSLYFEPEQKNASPRAWKLKKINGGSTVRIPDSEDDAPYNYYTLLREKSPGIAAETVYDRPDTLHYGIHRLYYFPDSIWTYGAGRDSLEIGSLTKVLNPQDTTFYFAYCDHYYSLKALGSNSRVKIIPGGYPENINFYSIILCPRQGLIYKNSPFKLRVWQLPVKVR